MKAKIKSIYSADCGDLKAFDPKSEVFSLHIRFLIGPEEEYGEESFDLHVCSPLWIDDFLKSNLYMAGRHTLIIEKYNFDNILSFMNRIVNSIEEDSWPLIAEKISCFAYWEFENYSECFRQNRK